MRARYEDREPVTVPPRPASMTAGVRLPVCLEGRSSGRRGSGPGTGRRSETSRLRAGTRSGCRRQGGTSGAGAAPQHRRGVLLGHRDTTAQQPKRLLNRGVVECDQRERASRADRAQPAVAFACADELGVSVDLGEGAVIGLVGVGDGVFGAVSGGVEAVLPARMAPRPGADSPPSAGGRRAGRRPRRGRILLREGCVVVCGAGRPRQGRPSRSVRVGGGDELDDEYLLAGGKPVAGVARSSVAVNTISRCSPRVVSLAS